MCIMLIKKFDKILYNKRYYELSIHIFKYFPNKFCQIMILI